MSKQRSVLDCGCVITPGGTRVRCPAHDSGIELDSAMADLNPTERQPVTPSIVIHTDGACLGNPGPGGFAAVIEWNGDRLTVTGGDPRTTNNRMELSAVIEALSAVNSVLNLRNASVRVRSDSKYVVDAFNQGWLPNWQRNGWRNSKKQPVPNRDLWEKLLREVENHAMEYVWVRGHAGDPMNELCDRLANEQAGLARTEPGYWASAGNPKSAVRADQVVTPEAEGPTGQRPSGQDILEPALERNEIAATALRLAILHQDGGKPAQARDAMDKALRHLEAQRKILHDAEAPGDTPF